MRVPYSMTLLLLVGLPQEVSDATDAAGRALVQYQTQDSHT